MKVVWHDTLDSTQEEIRRNIGTLDNMSVVAALFQTAGKGQRGNKWSSGRGENLTFSILIRPGQDGIRPISAKEQFQISIVSALSVNDLIEGLGIHCRIKWPNDIYVGDKKLCGMLIENQLSTSGMVESSIIGIGININQTDFPPQLMNPTSVAKITHTTYDIEPLLQDFLAIFTNLLAMEPKTLKKRYLDCLYRMGRKADYVDTKTGEPFCGTIIGIDEEALLKVEMPDGSVKKFAFKEISYVL